jgi:ParB-like chromosome segregation protein Spo0J
LSSDGGGKRDVALPSVKWAAPTLLPGSAPDTGQLPDQLLPLVRLNAPTDVPIADLLPADSPRLAGEDSTHVLALAEQQAALPPVLVYRPTMQVIDGMHRLKAAAARGAETVQVRFVEGLAAEDVFVVAVWANMAHGLPLSLADRRAAAGRIVISHPSWSDRVVAQLTGLSARTVREVRRQAAAGRPQLHSRLGRDGRVRPLSAAAGRRRVFQLLQAHPNASLRQVAAAAGVSTGTVRDVRNRMRRGEPPVPDRHRRREGRRGDQDQGGPLPGSARSPEWLLAALHRDPALRLSDSGRQLLRWLDRYAVTARAIADFGGPVPAHTAELLAELAAGCAGGWLELSARLRRQVATDQPADPAGSSGTGSSGNGVAHDRGAAGTTRSPADRTRTLGPYQKARVVGE